MGLDRDEGLLGRARSDHAGVDNLRFETGDATALTHRAGFDVVTSARALQWISKPLLAVEQMKMAAKPGGVLIVLDYNHAQNRWEPEPPAEFRRFYDAFLQWRQANGWDNEMADHLPGLFRSAGLVDVRSHVQDEVATRGDADFDKRSSLWTATLAYVAERLIDGGFCSKQQLEAARDAYESWITTYLIKQILVLRAVVGVVA